MTSKFIAPGARGNCPMCKTLATRPDDGLVSCRNCGENFEIFCPKGSSHRVILQTKPIETAPLNKPFLALEEDSIYKMVILARESGEITEYESYCGQYVTDKPNPTHWIPLPEFVAREMNEYQKEARIASHYS